MNERELYNRLTPEERGELDNLRQEVKAYINPQEQANAVVHEYTNTQLADWFVKIKELGQKEHVTEDEVVELIREANSWVSWTAGISDESYEAYRFHLIDQGNGKFQIIQGREIDTSPKGRE